MSSSADRYARSTRPILLVGATGTGAELFARRIHRRSVRPGPFVAINRATLAEGTADSLLLGHTHGAFSEAVRSHVGCLEEVHRGARFLKELTGLTQLVQPKLLRALDDRVVRPMGGPRLRGVTVRIVAAV